MCHFMTMSTMSYLLRTQLMSLHKLFFYFTILLSASSHRFSLLFGSFQFSPIFIVVFLLRGSSESLCCSTTNCLLFRSSNWQPALFVDFTVRVIFYLFGFVFFFTHCCAHGCLLCWFRFPFTSEPSWKLFIMLFSFSSSFTSGPMNVFWPWLLVVCVLQSSGFFNPAKTYYTDERFDYRLKYINGA